jgi:hypothetical protein
MEVQKVGGGGDRVPTIDYFCVLALLMLAPAPRAPSLPCGSPPPPNPRTHPVKKVERKSLNRASLGVGGDAWW